MVAGGALGPLGCRALAPGGWGRSHGLALVLQSWKRLEGSLYPYVRCLLFVKSRASESVAGDAVGDQTGGLEEHFSGPQAGFRFVGIFALCFRDQVPSAHPPIPGSGAETPEEGAAAWPSIRVGGVGGVGGGHIIPQSGLGLRGAMQVAKSPDVGPDHRVHPVCAHQLCDFGQMT